MRLALICIFPDRNVVLPEGTSDAGTLSMRAIACAFEPRYSGQQK